ncbi:MAG TPA: SDR family NAD(P)-dependent oxidoreductase [Roseiarcus sp.]|nr:SDR family NAD(P)-dependent oxidoreductase [Roseiarcus sp.]
MDVHSLIGRAKRLAVMAHDLATTPVAIGLALYLSFPETAKLQGEALAWIVPLFAVYAAAIFRFFRLYEAKWRFASLPDLFNIFRAASALAITLTVVDLALVARGAVDGFVFGEKVCFLYWILQLVLLGGPRIAYRYWRYAQARRAGRRERAPSILVLGRANEAEIVLRSLEEGMRRRFLPRGVLSPRASDRGASIRGVPVLGGYDELERIVGDANDDGRPIARLVFAPSEFASSAESERVVATARRLGLALSRLQTVEFGGGSALTPIEIEDLLFRRSVETDRDRLARFIKGRRVVVTGGGGSIGSEICACVAALGAAELLVVDNSEPALFAVGETLGAQNVAATLRLTVADVRDRSRIAALFDAFKPDLVFHAAALKQLPQLEIDWAEGVKTNVLGTANVVDAAVAVGAAAVLISTDKAVDPVSVLGATKRLSEMYGQLVDGGGAGAPRIISVRFGNVLGSVGSVVPKFKAQIERGGPVTVTHPDMVRYFMTVREAVDLVISAAAHADSTVGGEARASVYVLKMGQPARIVDLAERMIRLAGYEPGADIEIVFTGIRHGERLNEILFSSDEPVVDIGVEGVTAAETPRVDRAAMTRWLADLANAAQTGDRALAERVFAEAIPSYKRAAQRAAASVTDLAAHRASTGAERLRASEAGARD